MSIVIYITNKIISTHLLPHYVGVIGCLVELENGGHGPDRIASSLPHLSHSWCAIYQRCLLPTALHPSSGGFSKWSVVAVR